MEERNRQRTQGYISLDISYIRGRLLHSAFVIAMCAVIVGIGAYVALDMYMSDSYTAEVSLTVLSRDNTTATFGEYSVDSAVSRNVNVLNSDTLKDQIGKSELAKGVAGSVSAAQVPGTNLITLSATSGSAEYAFRLLKTATDSYPELAGYFETGYVIKKLDSFSADNIVKNQAQPWKYAAAAAAVVLLAGVGLTALLAMFSTRIYSQEQAEHLLDMKVLGVLQYTKKEKGMQRLCITDTVKEPGFVEEMDRLATVLSQSMRRREKKILMVSSILENEGKTTLAGNLALSLIRKGKRVILMDGDMRKPALARFFDKEVEEGTSVSDFLEGKASLDKVLDRQTGQKNLICLWQKQGVADPDRLLDGEKIKELLRIFRSHTDYVIIDTPPVGIARDVEILAGAVEATVLSMRQNREPAAVVNDVVDVLEDAGTQVLGGVINMAGAGGSVKKRNSKYGKYYYRYGYGKNGEE